MEELKKVDKDNDTRFYLNASFDQDPLFKRYKEMIKRQGSIEITDENSIVRIYNPYLFMILTTEKISVVNTSTKEDTIINGYDYLKSFSQGFYEGMEYFKKDFAVTPDTLYSSKYADDINNNYFHIKHPAGLFGWRDIKEMHPLTFDHKSIRELYGYYSGIIFKVEGLIKKYPAVFENFDKCSNKEITKLSDVRPEPKKTITKSEHLGLIFDSFKDYFKSETKDNWMKRFAYPNDMPIDPIVVTPKATDGSDRLILIGILSSIQKVTENNFVFDDFVLKRFGLKAFSKAKTDHKNKEAFTDTCRTCDRIINK